jgi:hypothetical protein
MGRWFSKLHVKTMYYMYKLLWTLQSDLLYCCLFRLVAWCIRYFSSDRVIGGKWRWASRCIRLVATPGLNSDREYWIVCTKLLWIYLVMEWYLWPLLWLSHVRCNDLGILDCIYPMVLHQDMSDRWVRDKLSAYTTLGWNIPWNGVILIHLLARDYIKGWIRHQQGWRVIGNMW